jgi:hypothetical protein
MTNTTKSDRAAAKAARAEAKAAAKAAALAALLEPTPETLAAADAAELAAGDTDATPDTDAETGEELELSEGEAEAEEVVTRSVVPRRWRNVYNSNALKGTCGDQLAYDLKAALESTSLVALGALNGVDVAARWGRRNAGLQRMCLGNVLRNRLKRGEAVNLS